MHIDRGRIHIINTPFVYDIYVILELRCILRIRQFKFYHQFPSICISNNSILIKKVLTSYWQALISLIMCFTNWPRPWSAFIATTAAIIMLHSWPSQSYLI